MLTASNCVSGQLDPAKVEEPIPDTLRFRVTKESKLDLKFFW
jgi:hypothetical protein